MHMKKSLSNHLSRRSFLRHSVLATGGAALALGTPHIRGRAAAVGSGVREGVRVGVIAVGNQGRPLMLQNFRNVVAVCDVDRDRLAAAKKEIESRTERSCAAHVDYRRLLESREVDAVIIATPDHWHAMQTIHACEAGKDVYVEKPLTLVVDEGRVMVKVARQQDRIVQTGSQQRSDDRFRLACELVRSGRIGKLQTIRVGLPAVNFNAEPVADSEPPAELDYDLWLGPAPWRPYNKNRVHYNFRFFWDYSGGQMTNWGAHHIDIAQWALGMDNSGPIEVEPLWTRFDEREQVEVPLESELLYRYPNGVIMMVSQGPNRRMGTVFEGTHGTIYVNRGRLESTPEEIVKTPLGPGDVRLYESRNHLDNWYECIKSRRLPICDVEIGHRSSTVCHLGSVAMRLGRKVTWDPVKELTTGDSEVAKRMSYEYRAPWKLPIV
jgi:predicted dehydrogenase